MNANAQAISLTGQLLPWDWFSSTTPSNFWKIKEKNFIIVSPLVDEQTADSSTKLRSDGFSHSLQELKNTIKILSVHDFDSDLYVEELNKIDSWFSTNFKFACDVIDDLVESKKTDIFLMSEIIGKIAKIDDTLTQNLRKKMLFNFSVSPSIRIRQTSVQGLFFLAKHSDIPQIKKHMRQEEDDSLKELYETLISWLKK
ncbi:hypothetical protein KJZ63_04165 [Patescibacteria group bacterium]|nr:hypothetical protein [Patescibacteria group bacterium]